jgi:general secretion pathway protein E
MGVDSYNLVSALNGVLAQRLVRIFCTSCQGERLRHCRGPASRGAGDRRAARAERRAARAHRRARAGAQAEGSRRAAGTVPLRDAALQLVHAGETTLEEINRVTFVA